MKINFPFKQGPLHTATVIAVAVLLSVLITMLCSIPGYKKDEKPAESIPVSSQTESVVSE